MTKVEFISTPVCPVCGQELASADGTLHCEQHGDFFSYGPSLLIQCVSAADDSPIPHLMPWERLDERT